MPQFLDVTHPYFQVENEHHKQNVTVVVRIIVNFADDSPVTETLWTMSEFKYVFIL